MLIQGKIRQRAFSLKFFSIQTKLILSLVFVFIVAIAFGYNYFQTAKADTFLYSETFTTEVKKDANTTTGKWDTTLGQARLLGKDWVNMGETKAGNEQVADEIGLMPQDDEGTNLDIQLYNDMPRISWDQEGSLVAHDARYIQWSGSQWTKPDGALGFDNLSSTGIVPSYARSVMHLDVQGNPRIIMITYPGIVGIIYTQWTPSACGGAGCWTKADGITYNDGINEGYDRLTNVSSSGDLALNSAGNPHILYTDSLSVLAYTRWTVGAGVGVCGTGNDCWTNYQGDVAGPESIPNLPGTTAYGNILLQMYNDAPQIVAKATIAGQTKIVYSKWTVGAGVGVCIIGNDCWTNAAGTIKGLENISGAFDNNLDWGFKLIIDSSGHPHVTWVNTTGNYEVFYTQWSGSVWTKADNVTPGPENISNSVADSSGQDFMLDSGNNPRFIWLDYGGGLATLYYTQWTPSACLGAGCWTAADNITLPNQNISQHPLATNIASAKIRLWDDKAKVIWVDNSTGDKELFYTQWNGGFWSKADNVLLGSDNVSNSASSDSYEADFELDSNGNPLIAYNDNKTGDFDIYFSKWLPDYKTSGIIQSINVNSGTDFNANATISATETLNGQTISYSLSNDGGATWESASNNTLHTFTSQGNDLRWKADLTGNASATPVINNLDITYQTKKINCSIDSASLTQGQTQVINATTSFIPTSIYATIQKNNTIIDTITLDGGPNVWSKNYPTTITNLGVNGVAILASDGSATYTCQPSLGDHWQKTTLSSMPWHSRYAHEVLSYGGYLWILGGYTNNYDNDVWRSQDGEHWDLITADAPWAGRKSFGSAVFDPDGAGPIPEAMLIFGGDTYVGSTHTFFKDVWWSTNGQDWTQLNDADWSAREFIAASVYDGKIWVSGGYNVAEGYKTDLWYTANPSAGWTQVTMTTGFGILAKHQMVTYDDGAGERLWILGGQNTTLPYSKNNVYEANANGTAWTQLKFCQGGINIGKICTLDSDCPASTCNYAPPWSARSEQSAIVYDYPGDSLGAKIMVMGGADNANDDLNDVWSYEPSQGWVQVIDPVDHHLVGTEPSSWTNWSARFRLRTAVHNRGSGNELFMIGGRELGNRAWNDVWTTTDGATWHLIGDNYDGIFGNRWASSMAAFNGGGGEKLWILGAGNDIWSSSDGVTWVNDVATADWSSRWAHKTLLYNNKLWLIGGCKIGSGGGGLICGGICNGGADNGKACTTYADCGAASTCNYAGLNDVWSSTNGTTWTQETANANFMGRYEFATAVFDDGGGEKMWILGGDVTGKCLGGTYINEICRANADCPGSTCSKVCVAGSNIGTTCSNATSCGGVGVGNCSNFALNDVLSSADGITWNLETAAAQWSTRSSFVALGYNSKLWAMAGFHSTTGALTGSYVNDVWSSDDGTTWSQATSNAAWNPRHTPALVEFQDKMWIYGGNNGFYSSDPSSRMDSNNVWWSTDGANWNQATGWAEWDGRDFFSYAVFQDRMWLMGGDSMGTTNNDVWASNYDYTNLNFTVNPLAPTVSIVESGGSTDVVEGGVTDSYDVVLITAPTADVDINITTDGKTTVLPASLTFTTGNWATPQTVTVTAVDDSLCEGLHSSIINHTATSADGDYNGISIASVTAHITDNESVCGSSPLPAPSAPSNLICQAIDLTENNTLLKAINWNFVDTASNEFGFRLYDGETLIREVPTQDLAQIQEKENLLPNKAYTRNVRAYNGGGNSSASAPATCYTLANKPNKIEITSISSDTIKIKLDPSANPAETQFVIRVASGTTINYLLPDGGFSPTESWHTYVEFGGTNGVVVTGMPMTNGNINAASVQMVLVTGQNYSFSAKAKNAAGIETVFSDINNSIPQTETGPKVAASKGVAVNLAWNSSFGLFSTAWAGSNFVIGLNGTFNRALGVFSWFLNIILLILLAMFSLSLYKTLKYLKHKFKYPDTFELIWSILSQEAHHTYNQHAPQTQAGVYHASSYHKHKKLHNLSQQTFKGAAVALGLKLIILVALVTGLITLNHSGLAQTPPYDQSGKSVFIGDVLTYIVEVANNGTTAAQSVSITDALSNYLTYEQGSAKINLNGSDIPNGFTVKGNNLTFDLGDLDINENAYVIFKAKVNAGSGEKFITNMATVNGSNFTTVATNTTSNEAEPLSDINENLNQPEIPPVNKPPVLPETVCGNGIIESGEACDVTGCPTDQLCTNCQCQTGIPPETTNTNGNINSPIIEPPESGTPESQIPIIGPIIDSIADIFTLLGQFEPVKILNDAVLNNPQVERASQNVVTPLIITVAIVNTLPAVLVITTYLLPYLHLIFLEPLLFFFGKKRKKWGVVYNSLTKKPVDLALVRLYNKETNQLIQTKVTDREGRYIMIAKDPGKYYLTITKPGFNSPSNFLKGEKQDTKYIDLYHGEVINVTEKDAVITANIPLDPAEKKVLAFAEVIRAYLLKNLRLIVSYVGLILSVIIVLIIPTAITVGALILHIILFLFFRHFLVPVKPKSWGIVYDDKTKEPLGSSVVRIFDLKFNKLLETQVTDSKGRYSFLVGKNEYQMLAEKPGYQNKEVKPVDLVKNEEIINLDVGLNKK